MKNQREIRKGLIKIFLSDKVTYKIKDKRFEISGKEFIQEELDSLIMLCNENDLWFYLYPLGYDKIIILVTEDVHAK